MRPFAYIGLLLLLLISCRNEESQREMAIATAHPMATDIGAEVLRKGGNAIDAAVATHFALAVCLPRAGNIGGGGFAVIHFEGKSLSLDFRETAPDRAHRDMYLDSLGDPIPNASLYGPLSAGIPGSVAGMYALHDSLGRLPWSAVVQPAIDLAQKGFTLDKQRTEYLNRYLDEISYWNPNGCAYTPQSKEKWAIGDHIRHPELARVLKEIRDRGRDGFYSGWVAQAMLQEVKEQGGIWQESDLAAYEVQWREPIEFELNDYRFICMPLPSSGGLAMLQLIHGAEQLGLMRYHPGSPEYTHLMAEIMNRVFALRAGPMGDPDYFTIPLTDLTDKEFLDSVFSGIRLDRRTEASALSPLNQMWTESVETTHFSVVDSDGNTVSLTTTLNGNYGSKSVVDNCGFFLNNEMDDFSIKPGIPNQFGLIGFEANSIEPGKRMLSSMSPTIVLKDGSFFLTTGSPGGSRIITASFQTILQVIYYGKSAQQAVDQPRMHSQWLPEDVLIETGYLSSESRTELTEMGYVFQERPGAVGKMELVFMTDHGLEAATDSSRVQGKAVVLSE